MVLLTNNNALMNAGQQGANGEKEIISKVNNLEKKVRAIHENITKKQQETIALVKNSNEQIKKELAVVAKSTENNDQSVLIDIFEKKLDNFQENVAREKNETLSAIVETVKSSNEALNRKLSIVKKNCENNEQLAIVDILENKFDAFQENITKEQQETVTIVKTSNEMLSKKLSVLRKNLENTEPLARVDNLEIKFEALKENITKEKQSTLEALASVKNSNESFQTILSIAAKNIENHELLAKNGNFETKFDVFQENITKEQQVTLEAISSVKILNETLNTKLSIATKNTENTEQLLRGFIDEIKNNNNNNNDRHRVESYEPCDYGYYSNNIPKHLRMLLNQQKTFRLSEIDEEM